MPQLYFYKARDDQGQIVQGQMEGNNEKDVAAYLRQKSYLILSISKREKKQNFLWQWMFTVNSKHLSAFCYQFATMLKAGLPILSCLQVLKVQGQNRTLGKIIQEVTREIEAGKNLTMAFSSYNYVFSNLFLSSLQVGETTGNLEYVLDGLAVYYKKDHNIRTKIRSALSYPLMVLVITGLITVLFIIFLLPLFQSLFANMNVQLPALTNFLFKVSSISFQQYLFLLFLVILSLLALVLYSSTEKGKMGIDMIKIKAPVFGSLIKKIGFARFSMSLALMIHSGVPLLQALDVAKDTVDNRVLAEDIEKVRVGVQGGGSISVFLEKSSNFPILMTRMIAVGEISGSLDTMLDRVAEFYEQEVQSIVENLTILLEPFLIIFLGLAVGTIILAILLPMTSLISNIANLGR